MADEACRHGMTRLVRTEGAGDANDRYIDTAERRRRCGGRSPSGAAVDGRTCVGRRSGRRRRWRRCRRRAALATVRAQGAGRIRVRGGEGAPGPRRPLGPHDRPRGDPPPGSRTGSASRDAVLQPWRPRRPRDHRTARVLRQVPRRTEEPLRHPQLGPARDRREHGSTLLRHRRGGRGLVREGPDVPGRRPAAAGVRRRVRRSGEAVRTPGPGAAAPRLDRRHRARPGPAPPGGGRGPAALLGHLVRHAARRDVREPVPRPGREDRGRRERRPAGVGGPRYGRRARAEHLPAPRLAPRIRRHARAVPRPLRPRAGVPLRLLRRQPGGDPGQVRHPAGAPRRPAVRELDVRPCREHGPGRPLHRAPGVDRDRPGPGVAVAGAGAR